MQSRAIVGLFSLSLLAAPFAAAHAPGVTHSYDRGEPVITVRLVPAEADVARAKRIDALDPATAPQSEPSPGSDISAAPGETSGSFDTAAPDAMPADETAMPAVPVPAVEETAQQGAAVTRYPSVKPALKPNSEMGVGGALDLAPPAEAEPTEPKPMRLNSVDRPRRVADRTQRPAPPREERKRPRRVQTEAAPAAPATPDPLDEALPPRVLETENSVEPANAMQLPPPKVEDRIADGN